jgi:hypothetical protein
MVLKNIFVNLFLILLYKKHQLIKNIFKNRLKYKNKGAKEKKKKKQQTDSKGFFFLKKETLK